VFKSAGAGVTTFDVGFTNAGDLNFNGRKMTFETGFTTQAGGKIDLAGGTMDMGANAMFNTLNFTAGCWSVRAPSWATSTSPGARSR